GDGRAVLGEQVREADLRAGGQNRDRRRERQRWRVSEEGAPGRHDGASQLRSRAIAATSRMIRSTVAACEKTSSGPSSTLISTASSSGSGLTQHAVSRKPAIS